MSNHTGTGWTVETSSYQGKQLKEQTVTYGMNRHGDGPEGVICKVVTGNPADGYLISAAPDMYEALDMVNNAIMDSESEIELADAITELCHNVSQALRKARG